jgi:protein-S-isoprenylcysteine O-methyltransferase Ste14
VSAVPIWSSSHQVFAAGINIYIFISLYFEEKVLIKEFGETDVDCMKRV